MLGPFASRLPERDQLAYRHVSERIPELEARLEGILRDLDELNDRRKDLLLAAKNARGELASSYEKKARLDVAAVSEDAGEPELTHAPPVDLDLCVLHANDPELKPCKWKSHGFLQVLCKKYPVYEIVQGNGLRSASLKRAHAYWSQRCDAATLADHAHKFLGAQP